MPKRQCYTKNQLTQQYNGAMRTQGRIKGRAFLWKVLKPQAYYVLSLNRWKLSSLKARELRSPAFFELDKKQE